MPHRALVRISGQDAVSCAAALAHAPRAAPELAGIAVEEACRRAGLDRPARVLLFLTPHLAACAGEAVKAAARTSQCMQVFGAVAPGIFTESEWVLDAPAAAALVLDQHFAAPLAGESAACALTLAAPDLFPEEYQASSAPRFGALLGEPHLHAEYAIWSAGRMENSRHAALPLGGKARFLVATGITACTPLWRVSEARDTEILRCEGRPLWRNLLRLLPGAQVKHGRFNLQRLFACISNAEPDAALASGEYEMLPALATNAAEDSVTLPRRVEPGTRLFWAIRDPLGAEAELRARLQALPDAMRPEFALMVSSVARGAGFFGGHDRDWQLVRERFPHLPLLGIYGAGELVPGAKGARLLHYAAALALFEAGDGDV